jgi:hypothetical protein
VKIQVAVFWVVRPCSLVVGHQRFRGPCCPFFRVKCLHRRENLTSHMCVNIYVIIIIIIIIIIIKGKVVPVLLF